MSYPTDGSAVFIDYGIEWEKAWDKHVREWQPPKKIPNFKDVPADVVAQGSATMDDVRVNAVCRGSGRRGSGLCFVLLGADMSLRWWRRCLSCRLR